MVNNGVVGLSSGTSNSLTWANWGWKWMSHVFFKLCDTKYFPGGHFSGGWKTRRPKAKCSIRTWTATSRRRGLKKTCLVSVASTFRSIFSVFSPCYLCIERHWLSYFFCREEVAALYSWLVILRNRNNLKVLKKLFNISPVTWWTIVSVSYIAMLQPRKWLRKKKAMHQRSKESPLPKVK